VRPALPYADYFGFVHGGESLTAPIFFDVLAAIQEARGENAYVAHLLTNGVLLTKETSRRLLALGVSSISVSLDGATAETNDAIRTGGRFGLALEHLRALVRMRRETSADLRVGISFVVLRQNAHEIDERVDLAADVGVDWVKLEEGAPINEFARRSLVGLSPGEVAERVRRATERAKALGIVLVDHTVERTIWRCRLAEDAVTAAFVAADEFANRSEIHPCRAPWEVACVEPNGDVRGGYFFGPILGNVTQEGVEEIWNGSVARAERARSRDARLCGPNGPVTCLDGMR
jgi:MoaA/NifB/PqqE/SkfB family radical SAM enzyme